MIGYYILAVAIVAVLLFLYFRFFTPPKFGNTLVVSGAVKTGKTMFSLRCARIQYYKQLIKYYIARFLRPFFALIFPTWRKRTFEKPLFYSNIPVVIRNYSPLTEALILRKERFRYGSVIFVDEASLVADSRLIKQEEVNEALLLFNKLIAHETRGGYLFWNTQAVNDLHYAIKRCTGSYFYIHHNIKIPFFVIMFYREMFFSDDGGGSTASVTVTGADEELKIMLVPKSIWKKYDRYAFSILTDHLPVADRIETYKRYGKKKIKRLVTFRDFKTIDKEWEKNI